MFLFEINQSVLLMLKTLFVTLEPKIVDYDFLHSKWFWQSAYIEFSFAFHVMSSVKWAKTCSYKGPEAATAGVL